ncbi:MAG: hypothetical protein QXK06_03565 [Candidatus Diapherotrites archaeon]
MEENTDFAGLLAKICKESGKSEKEALALVEEKKRKFTGLLTDSGAAFMVAKELGLKIDFEKTPEKTKISTLEEGLKGIELPVKVLHVYTAKEFEKDGKKGKYCRLLVGDETGEISLTLWGEQATEIEEKKVERGTILLLKNAIVSSYKGQLQITIPYDGKIEINPKIDTNALPKTEKSTLKIANLSEGMENIDLFARVIRVFEMNEFLKEGEKRKAVSFLLGDESGQIRATAWNNLAVTANRLEAGELVKIEGAYTKKGLNSIELHLGWNSRIIKNPTTKLEIPSLTEISKKEFKRKNIAEILAGEQVEVLGTITAINKGKLAFKVCTKCGSKAHSEGNSWLCKKCGETKPKDRLVATIAIDDGSGTIRASAFGRNAEKILDMQTQEITKMLEEKNPREIIEEISGSILGKKFIFNGITKASALNKEEIELTVNEVKNLSFEKEIKTAIEKIQGN